MGAVSGITLCESLRSVKPLQSCCQWVAAPRSGACRLKRSATDHKCKCVANAHPGRDHHFQAHTVGINDHLLPTGDDSHGTVLLLL